MMKKWIRVILCAAIVTLAVAGCKKKEAEETTEAPTESAAPVEIPEASVVLGEYMLGINADYDSQDKLNQALRQNGVVFQTLLSDAEQTFSYSLIRDFRAIACFAGPSFLVPQGTVRRPILDGEFTWNFYIYGRTTGRRPHAASDLVEEIIRFREMD